MRFPAVCFLFLILAASCTPNDDREGQPAPADASAVAHPDSASGQLGTVVFPVSCNEEGSRHAERGLALLHHMTYEVAAEAFVAASEADSTCAMGYWGQAMAFIHPLWSDPPTEAKFAQGQALVEEARTRGTKADWEQAYVEAAAAYYAGGRSGDERPNLAAFERGWERVHQQFPEDVEATAFYGLAHLATVDPGDKSYAKQRKVGGLMAEVLARVPDHPGAHHYTIHAYDVPSLAEQALPVARGYGEVAPAVPHALHMPTHIFTRRGLWQESITWNRRSAEAALHHPVGEAHSLHYLHALDYLAYAYLQGAEDQRAQEVLQTLESLEGPFQVEVASPYTLAAVPARLALERQDWAAAARLEPRVPDAFPWDNVPAVEAITHFARALGAARSADPATAREALDRLAALHERAAQVSGPYWAKQVEIQQTAAQAWLAYAEGKPDEALTLMRAAAELEASTEKHPVTPGEVLPARELLADMLLELERPGEALVEYEASLARSPNRFNSLYGAGRAAALAGDPDKAAAYYEQLAEVTARADGDRERLQQAKAFLAEQ